MFSEAHRIIEERLAANVSVPIADDNVEFIPKRGEAWVRPVMTQTASNLTTIASYGKGNYREEGLLTVQVFTPKNEGSRNNIILSDEIADLMRGYTEDRLFLQESRINRIGQTEEWYQSNVLIDFYYDNCLTA